MALSQLNNCIKSIKKLCDVHSVIFQAHINQHLPFLDSYTRRRALWDSARGEILLFYMLPCSHKKRVIYVHGGSCSHKKKVINRHGGSCLHGFS
jgi:hypothetical protein